MRLLVGFTQFMVSYYLDLRPLHVIKCLFCTDTENTITDLWTNKRINLARKLSYNVHYANKQTRNSMERVILDKWTFAETLKQFCSFLLILVKYCPRKNPPLIPVNTHITTVHNLKQYMLQFTLRAIPKQMLKATTIFIMSVFQPVRVRGKKWHQREVFTLKVIFVIYNKIC